MTKEPILYCSAEELRQKIETKADICILDVREPLEHRAEFIGGTINQPLSDFAQQINTLPKDKELFIICKSGKRSEDAARKLIDQGCSNVRVMQGGLDEWKKKGFLTQGGSCKVWTIERQVRCSAGALVLLGLAGAWLIHPSFLILTALVGTGLVLSAVTDTCGMAMLLAKMPWNQ